MKWIRCSDRLPQRGEYVLTTYKGKRFDVVQVDWIDDSGAFVCGPVEWWMPLPEPYKDGMGIDTAVDELNNLLQKCRLTISATSDASVIIRDMETGEERVYKDLGYSI